MSLCLESLVTKDVFSECKPDWLKDFAPIVEADGPKLGKIGVRNSYVSGKKRTVACEGSGGPLEGEAEIDSQNYSTVEK